MTELQGSQNEGTPPMPFIPSWKNIKIFLLGLVWCLLGTLPQAAFELWDSQHYDQIDWGHIKIALAVTVVPMLGAYWRKYRALISPPPEDSK